MWVQVPCNEDTVHYFDNAFKKIKYKSTMFSMGFETTPLADH